MMNPVRGPREQESDTNLPAPNSTGASTAQLLWAEKNYTFLEWVEPTLQRCATSQASF